jgi:hypothetical protein
MDGNGIQRRQKFEGLIAILSGAEGLGSGERCPRWNEGEQPESVLAEEGWGESKPGSFLIA